ncbi:MAG: PAS domain-containing protein, partial [Methanoregula sp.]
MVEGNWSNEKIRWMESFPDMNPNPIVEMDANGAITFFNSATQKTLNNLGFPENPAIFIPDDKVEILRLLKDSAESQVSREIILKDACFSENILFFREFQTVRIYVVNITKQRKAEWELVRKNDEITVLNERLTRLHNELGLILKYNKKCEEVLHHREETFRQAHEFLETVTKGTGVNIAIQDVNLRYLFFNNEYKKEIKRLTGKNLTLGTSMVELFREKPEEQKEAMIEWSKVLHGENINKIQEYGDPGKSHKVYHVIHIPIRDAKENIIGAGELAYDITEQVQIQDKLRETKEYFDNLITYANAPIIVWNPELRVTLFN